MLIEFVVSRANSDIHKQPGPSGDSLLRIETCSFAPDNFATDPGYGLLEPPREFDLGAISHM